MFYFIICNSEGSTNFGRYREARLIGMYGERRKVKVELFEK